MWIAELAIQQGPALVCQCMNVQFQGMRFAACLGVVFSLGEKKKKELQNYQTDKKWKGEVHTGTLEVADTESGCQRKELNMSTNKLCRIMKFFFHT